MACPETSKNLYGVWHAIFKAVRTLIMSIEEFVFDISHLLLQNSLFSELQLLFYDYNFSVCTAENDTGIAVPDIFTFNEKLQPWLFQ